MRNEDEKEDNNAAYIRDEDEANATRNKTRKKIYIVTKDEGTRKVLLPKTETWRRYEMKKRKTQCCLYHRERETRMKTGRGTRQGRNYKLSHIKTRKR